MIKLETNEEKKAYILQNWKRSDGKTITEMLKRYFVSLEKDTPEPIYKIAEKIFNPVN